MSTFYPLSRLPVGQTGVIRRIAVDGSLRRRLQDLGLLCGRTVVCLHRAPWGGPTAYGVCNTVLGLRQNDAARIFIEPEGGDAP
ncbi:MAG: ferrous iron transport protein A [Clostridia bacterium]|nr:ferrous iron transport protein A [Clostridia bacterium]MBQ7302688.1 ferrous iron transport protein A [Clostridia bacterium]